MLNWPTRAATSWFEVGRKKRMARSAWRVARSSTWSPAITCTMMSGWVRRSWLSRGTSHWAATPSVAAMRTTPDISRSRPARWRSIAVAFDIIDSAWTSTPRAAGVTSMPWRWRSNSLAPSRRSSAWMRRPTVVCLVFNWVAAALKLPVLATARKNLTSSQSPRIFGTLLLRGVGVTIITINTIGLGLKDLLGECRVVYLIPLIE